MNDDSRATLRRQMRRSRRSIDPHTRHLAAHALRRRVAATPFFRRAHRLAAYFAVDGEMDPGPLVDYALALGREVYMPVLQRGGHLSFARFDHQTALAPNRFGIPEPVCSPRCYIKANELDIVLTPLVAFDSSAHRLGMGGGYYDRSFSYLLNRVHWRKPKLIGLAYEMQRVASLATESWDVPLWRVVTECATYPSRLQWRQSEGEITK